MASTNKMWIKPETLYTKTPRSHPITKITAIIYRRLLIVKNLMIINNIKKLYPNKYNSVGINN